VGAPSPSHGGPYFLNIEPLSSIIRMHIHDSNTITHTYLGQGFGAYTFSTDSIYPLDPKTDRRSGKGKKISPVGTLPQSDGVYTLKLQEPPRSKEAPFIREIKLVDLPPRFHCKCYRRYGLVRAVIDPLSSSGDWLRHPFAV
jgi:hypothetical protein